MKYLSLVLLSLLSLTACKSRQEFNPQQDIEGTVEGKPMRERHLLISMERTPCFGLCPVDKTELYSDGSIIYLGEKNGIKEGKYIAYTNQGSEFVALYEKYYSDEYQDVYDDPRVSDLPSTTLRFYNEDQEIKSIMLRTEAPSELRELAKQIELLLISVDEWIEIGGTVGDE